MYAFFAHSVLWTLEKFQNQIDKLHKINLPTLAKSHAVLNHTVEIMDKKLVKM